MVFFILKVELYYRKVVITAEKMFKDRLLGSSRSSNTKEDEFMGKTFEERLEEKIKDSFQKRELLEANKEENKIKLKEEMIEKIEHRLLSAVPSYVKSEKLNLHGPIFFINEKDNKLYIEDFYGDRMVLFDDIEEIKTFVEEITAEFDYKLKYEFNIYENPKANIASIWFKYEYKKS